MRTLEDFKLIIQDLAKTLDGKNGDEFMYALSNFMDKYNFHDHVINVVHSHNHVHILFFTDHKDNENGILYMEAKKSCLLVVNINEFLQEATDFILGSI